jgi:hypothetical protein
MDMGSRGITSDFLLGQKFLSSPKEPDQFGCLPIFLLVEYWWALFPVVKRQGLTSSLTQI